MHALTRTCSDRFAIEIDGDGFDLLSEFAHDDGDDQED